MKIRKCSVAYRKAYNPSRRRSGSSSLIVKAVYSGVMDRERTSNTSAVCPVRRVMS